MADCWNVDSSFWLNLSCVFTFYNFQLYRYLFISTNYCDTGTDLETGPTGTAPQQQQNWCWELGDHFWPDYRSNQVSGGLWHAGEDDLGEEGGAEHRLLLQQSLHTHTQYGTGWKSWETSTCGCGSQILKLKGSRSYRYLLHILIFRFLRICICISESMLLKLWPRMQIREKLPNLEP